MPEIEHSSSQINATTSSEKASETSSSPSSSPSSSSSENALFGKYKLGMLLGRGSFAKVYQGLDVRTGKCVAIKVIDKRKLVIPALAENIKREITIMRHLRSHPNIIGLHEVLATRTKVYFVMDFVEGGELYARVSRGRFSEDVSREYFRQLIFAVGYCHSRGVYHRDLKPENLLIGENGDLKVGDFGLSAVKGQRHTDGLLHTQCGTPAYVAPEILSQKGYDGAKVDVWACGVVLYVLTAGCLPFNDANLFNMYKKIRKGEFHYPKWMSSDLRGLLSRILDPNPETRITIDEITRDPWFTLDSEPGFENEYEDFDEEEEEEDEEFDFLDDKNSLTSQDQTLNAFDLISFSPGLDLSGLFQESGETVEVGERFLSEAPAEEIIERIEGAARAERLKVNKKEKKKEKKKEAGLELERQNGCFVAKVEISRLTDQLVVVEVARKVGEERSYDEMWMKKLRPELGDFVYQNDIYDPDEITPPSSPPPPSNDDDDAEESNF